MKSAQISRWSRNTWQTSNWHFINPLSPKDQRLTQSWLHESLTKILGKNFRRYVEERLLYIWYNTTAMQGSRNTWKNLRNQLKLWLNDFVDWKVNRTTSVYNLNFLRKNLANTHDKAYEMFFQHSNTLPRIKFFIPAADWRKSNTVQKFLPSRSIFSATRASKDSKQSNIQRVIGYIA